MDTDQQKFHAINSIPENYYINASETERQTLRESVRTLLQTTSITVDFEKATGELRSMKCTLSQDLGAKYTVKENTAPKKPNPDVCVVWDVNQAAWRSFRWDRMKRIQFDLG